MRSQTFAQPPRTEPGAEPYEEPTCLAQISHAGANANTCRDPYAKPYAEPHAGIHVDAYADTLRATAG
eukprot:12465205-Alexandrium_andersonii.AAC.1